MYDIFNKKKVKALQAEVEKLKDDKFELGKLLNDYKQRVGYLETTIHLNKNEIKDLERQIADLKNKLTLATRLNEIYAAKPSTEGLEKAIKKNQETINMHLEREKAYIKRIDELEKIHTTPNKVIDTMTHDVPIEDYNYGGKIPTRDPKTGRFMKS